MQGFIYIWRDKVRNMYYVGSHDGTPTDGYISSSKWLNAEYRFRPDDFRRKILKFIDLLEMKKEEYRIISMIKESEYGTKFYNIKSGRKPGSTPWNKGKTNCYSDAHRKAISESRIGVSTTKGRKFPNQTGENNNMNKPGARQKLSAKATGRKRKYLSDGSWVWSYPEFNCD